jgi:hypothetical protein
VSPLAPVGPCVPLRPIVPGVPLEPLVPFPPISPGAPVAPLSPSLPPTKILPKEPTPLMLLSLVLKVIVPGAAPVKLLSTGILNWLLEGTSNLLIALTLS